MRWTLYGLLAVLVLVALAPYYLGPLLRGTVERQLGERLGARATVQSLVLRWPAHVRANDVLLSDASGAPLFSLDELRADVGLSALVTGRIEADVELSYPELHVSRDAAGRWNFESVLERVSQGSHEDEREQPPSDELPEVEAHVRVRDGHVIVHGPGGETTLSELTLELDVDGLERPAPFRLSLNARGPDGPAGALRLEGSLTAASDGRIEPLGMAGELALALEQLDLAGFAPALALVAPLEALGGVLDGKVDLTLAPGLALTGTSAVELRALRLQGPRASAPVNIESLALHGEASQQGEGAGTQRLELRGSSAGTQFLALLYEGRSDLASRGPGSLAGTLTLTAELGPLTEIARGWAPLQAGVEVEGRLEHRLELTASLADRKPERARVQAQGGVTGLAARDAKGRALDLAELTGLAFELDAGADWAAGTLSVTKLELDAGPVTCSGSAEATGLASGGAQGELALRTGALRLEADLERLRGTLAQLVELTPDAFGGRVKADVTLGVEGDGLALRAVLDGQQLAFAGTRLATLGGELSASRTGTNAALSGAGELNLGTLTLTLAEGKMLELPGTKLTLGLQEDAAGKGQHSVAFVSTDGAFGLTLDVESTRSEAALALQSRFGLTGQLARLTELGAAFVPFQPGLEGELLAEGEARVSLEENTLVRADGKLDLGVTGLVMNAMPGSGPAVQPTLALEGSFDARAGTAEVARFALNAGGLDVSGTARATGLFAGASPTLEAGRIALQADLARLGRELAGIVELGGWSVDGSPLVAEVDLATVEQRIEAKGSMTLDELRLTRAEGAPISQAGLGFEFDLGYDHALGSLHVRKAAAHSQTAALSLAGTLNELADPARARGAMQLTVSGALERILGDLGLETAGSGRSTRGELVSSLALEGDRGAFRVTGKTSIADFRLELAPAQATDGAAQAPENGAGSQTPLVVEEASIVLDLAASVALPALDIELEKLTLTSDLARGGARGRMRNLASLASEGVRFEGLAGEFAYVPDRLGLVLAPWLPGKLSGAEEERVTFTLEGHARAFDPWTLLTSSSGRVDVGLGRFERPEIQLDGVLALETKPEKLVLRGDLTANGGTLQLDSMLDLGAGKAPPRSRLTLTAKDLRANSGLAPLLALVHPAFASAELAQGALDGVIALNLDVTYDGPLTPEALQAGWQTLPKTPINGSGRLELREASLRGSPLLAMLSEFGIDASKTLDVRPIEFTIQKGRVSYAKPWTWSLAGTETTFSGTIGLDQTLDLAWNLPITGALIERWSFLSSLEGETLSIPLRGTALKPRLEADSLLKDLAAKAAKKELESRLGLGRGKSGDDPETLLANADELWKAGKKAEAALVYHRLREEFKLSLTYALNKDRIKDRSKFKDPPK